ncbi:hypothetical protein QYM36_010745 [Artemia franciscana]|uniref:Uncharacterized protein n=1 Tax=Artemia franciscana TaxID=6661 RepID=A0AA88L8C3_ARTSF|nr:hypothetical protein QYM36_010745 [Artemia franciscana]
MAEDIGSIHVEADLNDIRRKEAAAIESIEGKLLGYCPKGGLGAVAMTAAARNEGVDAPMDRRGSGNATTCEVDLEEGLARRDFGNVRIEVDLNQVRQEEALALQAVESRLIGDVPPGGIGSVSTIDCGCVFICFPMSDHIELMVR